MAQFLFFYTIEGIHLFRICLYPVHPNKYNQLSVDFLSDRSHSPNYTHVYKYRLANEQLAY